MAIMGIKLDNVLSFYDFSLNFSYPSKLKTNLIEGENLKNVPKFRYKKLNVFIGSNATGKTSLIKCIWKTLLFLSKKEKNYLTDILNKKYEKSTIQIDIAEDNDIKHKLHRFKIITDNSANDVDIKVSHTYVNLSIAKSSSDSYEIKSKELDQLEDNFLDYLDCLKDLDFVSGWNIVLPATESNFNFLNYTNTLNEEEAKAYLEILNSVIKTLDRSIINVSKSLDADNAYVLEHENIGKIIIQDGVSLSSIPYLSSGTKYGINIANMMFGIKFHRNEIYLIDEQFSYVNSDIEAAMLSTMVSMLDENEQIFYTTHNSEILSLGFPFHSFYFMKKEMKDGKYEILASCGSDVENRNNVSPKTILDNDLFASAPDVNSIFELGDKHE